MERRKRERTSMTQAELERSAWARGEQAQPAKKSKKGRKRSAAEAGPEPEPEEPAPAHKDQQAAPGDGTSNKPARSRKRKAEEAGVHVDAKPAPAPKKQFQHLKPRTRHISQDAITQKWTPATAAAQQQVRDIFVAAKRPVSLNRRDDKKRLEAEITLASVLRKLEKQLPRYPFPPKTKEVHFNLEKMLERNRELENQLTPAIHSVNLLKAEVEKEEEALEEDRAHLAKLEANAKAELQMQRHRAAKMHPLLRAVKKTAPDDDAENVNMVRSSATAGGLDEEDPDLQPLLDQLRNHVDSIQSNSAQVDGVEDALSSAHAAVDELLHKRLDAQQYGRLMG